jgi:ABC-type phosphate transport system substrate-binding protein
MSRTGLRKLLLVLAGVCGGAPAAGGIVVIGHPGVPELDTATVQRIYTGRVIEVNGVSVTAVNASAGSPTRNRFLQDYLNQDEDKYTAYWIVRRYVGKGASPRELPRSEDIINFVRSTPGAIGYVDETDLRPGVNVLLK